MEYEIEFEQELFDDSTNPSLDHAPRQPATRQDRAAVRIPETELETQMG